MRLVDLLPSAQLNEQELEMRAIGHLGTIFGGSEWIRTFSDSDVQPDFAIVLPDHRVFVFEVKQPRRDFALGVSQLSQLVQLTKLQIKGRPVTLFLLTGKSVSEIFANALRDHGVPVVRVGESAKETLRNLEDSSSAAGIPLPRLK